MSKVLKGLLQAQIQTAINTFGAEVYTGPPSAAAAQAAFVDQLSTAIALAVQQYLSTNVTVQAGQLVQTIGGPSKQEGATITPGILIPQ